MKSNKTNKTSIAVLLVALGLIGGMQVSGMLGKGAAPLLFVVAIVGLGWVFKTRETGGGR